MAGPVRLGVLGAGSIGIRGALAHLVVGDVAERGVRQGEDVLSNINPAWYWRKPGGGPVYDMTVYGLHALTGILGPAKRVTAFSGALLKEREFRGQVFPSDCDDNTLILVDFGDALF